MHDPTTFTRRPSGPAVLSEALQPPRAAPTRQHEREGCFHCGERNAPGSRWLAIIHGEERAFCCAGCMGVAQTLQAAGLDAFYEQREGTGTRPQVRAESLRRAAEADATAVVVEVDDRHREVALLLDGIHCAACISLIEIWLRRQAGVVEVGVNFATARAQIRWDRDVTDLAAILAALARIGYAGYPYDPRRREAQLRRELRTLLTRTAIAWLLMMQVMMFAMPLYVSADGVEPEYQTLFNWASLLLSLPALFYCAVPFFSGAWRDLRRSRAGMDVPVAMGIGGAFAASVWSVLVGHGEVYFDSMTMFVALLLGARYLEARTRARAGDSIEALTRDVPATAERLHGDAGQQRAEIVAAARLAAGDIIRVGAGACVPADGEVMAGRSSVEEALLTGESMPRAKARGDSVLAGSLNRESPLIVRVSAAGAATKLAALGRLVERAANSKPRIALLADRVAARFVAMLLLVAAGTALAWWYFDASRALLATLAVLVVSCPCALSLATPAAMAAATAALARRQVLVLRGDALEVLARATHVVFDKTGTLTMGRVRLRDVAVLGALTLESCINLAARLEQGSAHPLADALRLAAGDTLAVTHTDAVLGSGVEGVIDGRRYRCGRQQWAAELHQVPLPAHVNVADDAVAIAALADESGWLALFTFADTPRPGAAELVRSLACRGIAVSLLSGDRSAAVERFARCVGIAEFRGDARPGDKCEHLRALQARGAVVAMVGDGINDAPSLAQADVSLSFGAASALTRWTAGVALLDGRVQAVVTVIDTARRTSRVIRQNLVWAFAYNAVAIPLAASGRLAPLVAAAGMSLSSLLVVGNAARCARIARAAATLQQAHDHDAALRGADCA